MQVRKKTAAEKRNVQPTQKRSSGGGGRDATARGVSDAVPVCVRQLIPNETWKTLKLLLGHSDATKRCVDCRLLKRRFVDH